MQPSKRITDPAFVYIPASHTDIRATFDRIRRERVIGFQCEFCRTVYHTSRSDSGTGADIVCCGEIGHVLAYTAKQELEDAAE